MTAPRPSRRARTSSLNRPGTGRPEATSQGTNSTWRTPSGPISSYFGRDMPTHANIATAMSDMHEHLGQLIAYARTNHVVPPWSAGN